MTTDLGYLVEIADGHLVPVHRIARLEPVTLPSGVRTRVHLTTGGHTGSPFSVETIKDRIRRALTDA